LILSKAILCTEVLEALRGQINAAQNQKCFGLKDLPLAVRCRRCSRLGRASSPTVGERALPASQQIGNLGTWEVSRGALIDISGNNALLLRIVDSKAILDFMLVRLSFVSLAQVNFTFRCDFY
jgi:hypothetical protein